MFDTIPADHNCQSQLGALSPEGMKGLYDGAEQVMVPGTDPGTVKIARKAEGSCVFYGKDHLCAVHKILGAAAKPQVCRDFPYRYVETPGGSYVGLSFVCPSVRGNLGQAVSEQEDALLAHRKTAASVQDAPETIHLNRRIALTWEEYLALESSFLDLLSAKELPVSIGLIACSVVAAYVDAFEIQRDGTPRIGPGVRFHDNEVQDFLNVIKRAGYADAINAAQRPRKISPMLRRMILGMFTSFANVLHRSTGRLGTVLAVVASYAVNASPWGRIRLKPIPGRVSHKRLAAGRLPSEGNQEELLRRYVSHCIFRKDLLLGSNVTRRLRLLILQVSLLPWYAEAEAASHGRATPTDEDFSEAIAHVERLYGFHSKFFRFFEANPYFDDIAESFMLRPSYPYFMLGALR